MREDDPTASLPPWFRRWGIGAWLVVGMALVIIAGTWLLAKTSSIANPLIAGAVIAAVSGVIVDRLDARRWPRVAGAAVVTFGTVFTSFFLLKDGPAMGRWIERHMGMRPAEARIVTSDIVQALRRYFLCLTIVGAFNTAIVTLGALVLGVPLLGTIAAGTLFGMAGLILAAPLVSAAVSVHDQLAELRGAAGGVGTAAGDGATLAGRAPPATDAPSTL